MVESEEFVVNDPHWLDLARNHIGLREVPGGATAPQLRRWLEDARAWWLDDETPWCGLFPRAIFAACEYATPKEWYRARAWLSWGLELPGPLVGCITVYERGAAGHVSFTVGRSRGGMLLGLGGNQGDEVRVSAFPTSRVLGHRWPREAITLIPWPTLPTIHFSGSSTDREV